MASEKPNMRHVIETANGDIDVTEIFAEIAGIELPPLPPAYGEMLCPKCHSMCYGDCA